MKKRINKNHLNAKQQFREAAIYLKQSQKHIYSIVILFFLSMLFGFLFRSHLTVLNDLLRGIIDQTRGLSAPELIFFIMQNNMQTSLVSMLLGMFLGIFPLVNAIMNGVVVGYVIGLTYNLTGETHWLRLVPHGIFELPAVFISLGLGIKLGFSIFAKKAKNNFKNNFYNSLNVFLLVVIPLLIIAAIIEGLLIAFYG